MHEFDLIDLEPINPDIFFDIRYATENNFLNKKFYPFPKCFLRRKVAEKIGRIQKKLQKKQLGLKIFDGYRPLSVQKAFWEFLPDPRYIGDPKKGSCHNRGAAVDLTLVDKKGNELQMPTPFDDFTEKAHHDYMNLPKDVIKNRQTLEEAMREEGFIPVPTEWWHYDDEQWEVYPVEDIPFESLI